MRGSKSRNTVLLNNKNQRNKSLETSSCRTLGSKFQLPWISSRAAGIGYGKRHDFTKRDDSPPPGSYQLPATFGNEKNSAPRFGSPSLLLKVVQRQVSQGNSGTTTPALLTKPAPGPGTYNPYSDFGTDVRTCTLKGKIHSNLKVNLQSPSPGDYITDSAFDAKTASVLSNHKYQVYIYIYILYNPYLIYRNTGSSNFSKFQTPRFKLIRRHATPGPGSYNPLPPVIKRTPSFGIGDRAPPAAPWKGN